MLKQLKARIDQGMRTHPFPKEEPVLPAAFRGVPRLDSSHCSKTCRQTCVNACPTGAIAEVQDRLQVDLGRCLFCRDCSEACVHHSIRFCSEYRLATTERSQLFVQEKSASGLTHQEQRDAPLLLVKKLKSELLRVFGRSLHLRQVSAGGCNGCEVEVNVLNTLVFDLGRFGIQFTASPRHADGVLVTGPVTQNMKLALQKTYDAIPPPKLVIATGACAVSGGLFSDHAETNGGLDGILPIDLYIPGCPPHPFTILDGLLRLLGKR